MTASAPFPGRGSGLRGPVSQKRKGPTRREAGSGVSQEPDAPYLATFFS